MTDETAKLREAQRIAAELRAKYHRERARLDALSAERDQLALQIGRPAMALLEAGRASGSGPSFKAPQPRDGRRLDSSGLSSY